ncbi:hypothetical protein R6Q59_014720 [Mikania micrantha]
MREDESNWFSKWEDELPSPEDLMPIRTPNNHQQQPPPSSQPNSGEFDSPEMGAGADEPARTLKRPRLVWTPQ